MRAECRTCSAMTLIATKITAAETSAIAAVARRESGRRFIGRLSSIGLLEIDQHGVGEEKDADHRGEEDGVGEIDDAADNSIEVCEEAEGRDGAQHRLGRPALEE